MRRVAVLACLLSLAGVSAWAKDAPTTASGIDAAALKRHVEFLADPAMKGRRDWPSREKAAAHIAEHFEKAGLKLLPKQESMFVDTPGVKEPALRNVAAWLPSKKGPDAEYVILSAHYDHLGTKTQVQKTAEGQELKLTWTYAGADDNATGVAALLELARCFGTTGGFDRSLVFVAFDLEEQGLKGSYEWVEKPPLPLEKCAAHITMDMLGRSLADMLPGSLFLMGAEFSAGLHALASKAPEPANGKKYVIGVDLQPGRSDYVPFHEKKIPAMLITGGACTDYHQPGDVIGRIAWEHLHARAQWMHAWLPTVLNAKERPAWRDEPEPTVQEIEHLRHVIGVAKEQVPKMRGVPPVAKMMVTNFHNYLGKILEDGVVTKQERTNARNTAMALFRMAVQAQGG